MQVQRSDKTVEDIIPVSSVLFAERNISAVLPNVGSSHLKTAPCIFLRSRKRKQSGVCLPCHNHGRNISTVRFFKLDGTVIVPGVGTGIRPPVPHKRSMMVLKPED